MVSLPQKHCLTPVWVDVKASVKMRGFILRDQWPTTATMCMAYIAIESCTLYCGGALVMEVARGLMQLWTLGSTVQWLSWCQASAKRDYNEHNTHPMSEMRSTHKCLASHGNCLWTPTNGVADYHSGMSTAWHCARLVKNWTAMNTTLNIHFYTGGIAPWKCRRLDRYV